MYIYIYICQIISIYHIYHKYIYHAYNTYIKYKCRISTELHLWFDVWDPLAALSANVLGKYIFFNRKAMFIFETKLASCFS